MNYMINGTVSVSSSAPSSKDGNVQLNFCVFRETTVENDHVFHFETAMIFNSILIRNGICMEDYFIS